MKRGVKFFVPYACVAVLFTAAGVAIGYFIWSESDAPAITNKQGVDRVLQGRDSYRILENQFIYVDPHEHPVELQRYALQKILDGGGSQYESVLAMNSMLWRDAQCQDLFLTILKQELDQSLESLVYLAKGLHNEADPNRYSIRVDLIIDYLDWIGVSMTRPYRRGVERQARIG